jgi:hypothetical protein
VPTALSSSDTATVSVSIAALSFLETWALSLGTDAKLLTVLAHMESLF